MKLSAVVSNLSYHVFYIKAIFHARMTSYLAILSPSLDLLTPSGSASDFHYPFNIPYSRLEHCFLFSVWLLWCCWQIQYILKEKYKMPAIFRPVYVLPSQYFYEFRFQTSLYTWMLYALISYSLQNLNFGPIYQEPSGIWIQSILQQDIIIIHDLQMWVLWVFLC